MKNNVLFIAALILFDGVAVAWAAWELWSIRKRKTEAAENLISQSAASKEAPGHLEREHGANDG